MLIIKIFYTLKALFMLLLNYNNILALICIMITEYPALNIEHILLNMKICNSNVKTNIQHQKLSENIQKYFDERLSKNNKISKLEKVENVLLDQRIFKNYKNDDTKNITRYRIRERG